MPTSNKEEQLFISTYRNEYKELKRVEMPKPKENTFEFEIFIEIQK